MSINNINSQIILASSNKGKIAEFNAILSAQGINLAPQDTFHLSEVEETGLTFVENAIIKARHACQRTGLPSIADDSGLVIDALDGRPGIYSARYAGKNSTNLEKIAKILDEMTNVPPNKRTARFVCIIVYMQTPDDPLPLIFQGKWEGSILHAPQGEYGFGYDPVFYVPEYDCSAAELEPKIKNQMSHRARALNDFARYFGR